MRKSIVRSRAQIAVDKQMLKCLNMIIAAKDKYTSFTWDEDSATYTVETQSGKVYNIDKKGYL